MSVVEKRNIIGKNIRNIRIKKNITQDQLAARLNVQGINMDRTIISRIENQTREIVDFEIKGISIALSISIEELFIE